MRPKPSRDWVMLELERLGVRVVSGRLGRKAGEEDDSDKKGGKNYVLVSSLIQINAYLHSCGGRNGKIWLDQEGYLEQAVLVGHLPMQTSTA
jgi:hypothetical protein